MSVCDLLHQSQTDAMARPITRGGMRLSVRKAVENGSNGVRFDSHAVVTHLDEDVVMASSDLHHDRPSGMLVRESVIDKGGDRAAKRRA